MKICIVVGTRPEIIKMAPIIRECQKRRLKYFVIHTKQHYSRRLDGIFFEELDLPRPSFRLNSGSGTHAEQTAKMLLGIERILQKERPSVVLVEGDTNTVLSGALAAVKLNIPVGHVEAGLRSYCRIMPEETNRVLVDHCSEMLFAPTRHAGRILKREGISTRKIWITGNTVVDAVRQNIVLAKKKSRIRNSLGLEVGEYFLVTLHRAENVDDGRRLLSIMGALRRVGEYFQYPLVFPAHPRTAQAIKSIGADLGPMVRVINPVGYLDSLQLQSGARLVLTDSGGIQEEACVLRVPCVTLRDNTERPETVATGANTLAGASQQRIVKAVTKMLKRKRTWENPLGRGDAAKKIMRVVTAGQARR